MTPPIRMVSVPVEPTGAMLVAADNAVGPMVASDASQHDFHRAAWSAMLTAAPVREEGGAWTLDDMRELVSDEQVRHLVSATDVAQGRIRLRDILNALATREEAPAEAGEVKIALALREARRRLHSGKVVLGDIDAIVDAVTFLEALAQPPAREEVGCAEPEVGRAVYERIERLLTDDPQGWERRYLSHLVESVEEVGSYDGPPAREDAQPAGLDVLEGWEDPKTPSVPGPVAWRCRNIGGVWSYGEAKQPNVAFYEPLYDHPAPDALRVAVEALEPFAYFAKHGTSREYINSDAPDDGLCAAASFPAGAYRGAVQALAALQAEQKGGA